MYRASGGILTFLYPITLDQLAKESSRPDQLEYYDVGNNLFGGIDLFAGTGPQFSQEWKIVHSLLVVA
jgi:hypothetical protein